MKTKFLKPNDRAFFSLVSQAVFANPFSLNRTELDRKISKAKGHSKPIDTLNQAIRQITKKLEELDAKTPCVIQDFAQANHDLIKHVFLFDIFHQFSKLFDQLIVKQIEHGQEPVNVPFAKDALKMLAKRGFSKALANQFFSLFYQLRRAFYFINNNLIGQCQSMIVFRENLWNNIFTHNIFHYEQYLWDKMEDFSTLLLGPTGCGKGAAAAAIGRSGFIPFDEKKETFAESFTKTFIPVNISQYPQTLLESELFGHAKGSFTGAIATHEGLFGMCRPYGSIFLDEIGDITPHVQVKLLKVLEERIFSPVGSHDKQHFHGRIIAATNKSLDELRQKAKFRDDLYYRLCSDCIMVPSLAQRIKENPTELTELIGYTIEWITKERSQKLTQSVLDVIANKLPAHYHWPGNVRELAQCVRRVIIKNDYQPQEPESQISKDNFLANIDRGKLKADELLAGYCVMLYKKHGTYEQVARKTGLDRRTVKKHIESHECQ